MKARSTTAFRFGVVRRCVMRIARGVSAGAAAGVIVVTTMAGASPGSVARAQHSSLAAADQKAERILQQAWDAIGSPDSMGNVLSLVLSGETTITGVPGVPRPRAIEVRFLLPDRYLRIVHDDATTEYSGFAADQLLSRLDVHDRGRQASAAYASLHLPLEREAFARLLLGLLATASPVFPLKASTPLSPGQCSGGPCLRIDGPDTFSCLLDFTADTHLPSTLRYEGRLSTPVAAATGVQASRPQGAPDGRPVAIAMIFEEWRHEGRVTLPHSIVTKVGNEVREKMVISRAVVNAPLTESDFRGSTLGRSFESRP